MSTDGTRETGRPAPMGPRRTNKGWSLALGGMVVVFVVLAGYDLASGGAWKASAVASSASASASSPGRPAATPHPAPATRSASRSAVPSPSLTSPASSPTVSPVTLTVASVAAFGPQGTSDGDNPGLASRLVNGGGAWYSSWYTTPEFGNLQSGTGILLDMGRTVTVNSVRVELGSAAGADVQLRVGDTDVFDHMSQAASVSDVGGTVDLSLSAPATGRYVLIWFTRLPPNSQGEYQISVYNATVSGHL